MIVHAGDTLPVVIDTIKVAGEVVDLTDATVNVVVAGPVTVEGVAVVAEDATTGVVTYAWQAGDTDEPGVYQVRWVVETELGTLTVPGADVVIYDPAGLWVTPADVEMLVGKQTDLEATIAAIVAAQDAISVYCVRPIPVSTPAAVRRACAILAGRVLTAPQPDSTGSVVTSETIGDYSVRYASPRLAGSLLDPSAHADVVRLLRPWRPANYSSDLVVEGESRATGSDVAATQVTYEQGDGVIEATTVQGALDWISANGAGGAGVPGPQGDVGPAGPQGEPGPTGPAGTTIHGELDDLDADDHTQYALKFVAEPVFDDVTLTGAPRNVIMLGGTTLTFPDLLDPTYYGREWSVTNATDATVSIDAGASGALFNGTEPTISLRVGRQVQIVLLDIGFGPLWGTGSLIPNPSAGGAISAYDVLAGDNITVTPSEDGQQVTIGSTVTTGPQGPQGDPGPQGEPGADALWNFLGAYGAGTAYAVGDVVTYDGETWYRVDANGGNVGDTPSEGTFWTKVAAKGATGATGPTGATGATGPAGVTLVGGQDEGTSIVNSAAATSLLDSTITLTGTAGDTFIIRAGLRYLNNTGAARVPSVALKIGSTTVATVSQSIAASANSRYAILDGIIRVEAANDLNAMLGLTMNSLSALAGYGVATEAIQSGVALDLVGTITSNATHEMQLMFVTVQKVAA